MKKFLLSALTIITFCSFFWNSMSKQSKIVHRIVREVSDKYEKKYKLSFSGISLAAPRGIYNDIGISFDYKGILSKDQARKILVESATDLIEKINANEELRPYLKNYLFTGGNVTINIFFHSLDGKSIYYPEMTIVSFYSDTLRYKYDSPDTEHIADYYLVEKESLEEARQILEQQTP